MKKTQYDDVCEVKCIDNGKTVNAEILDFKPEQMLSVSVNRSIRVDMKYNARYDIYIGSKAGMEFSSSGPREYTSYTQRK